MFEWPAGSLGIIEPQTPAATTWRLSKLRRSRTSDYLNSWIKNPTNSTTIFFSCSAT